MISSDNYQQYSYLNRYKIAPSFQYKLKKPITPVMMADLFLKWDLVIESKSELDDDSNTDLIKRYNNHVTSFRNWVSNTDSI